MSKTVLITGGTRGIGRGVAEKFSENGYNVAVLYNKDDSAASALFKNTGAFAIKADVSDSAAVNSAVAEIYKRFGKIDAVINNAGIALRQKTILDCTEEEFDKIFAVDVRGVFTVCKSCVPYMLDKGGSIVNVSSMWGITGGSCEVIYSAAKAAVIGLTKSLAKELASAKIRVNAVAPGFIDTDMNAHLTDEDRAECLTEIPLGRFGTPDDVAEAIFYLADGAKFITGEILNINGGEII